MMFIKKFIPLALLAALLLSAAGCKSNDDQSPATTDQTAQGQAGEQTPEGGQSGTQNSVQPTMVDGVEDWGDSTTKNAATTPTQSGETQPTTKPTQSQQPTEEPTLPPAGTKLTIEEYEALPTSQQQAYFQSFATVDAFYDWLEEAEANRKPTNSVTGDGKLDLNDFINGNR